MDDSDVRELAQLRARAFGRDADIDEPGLRRLAELEARASAHRDAAGPAASPVAPAPVAPAPAAAAPTARPSVASAPSAATVPATTTPTTLPPRSVPPRPPLPARDAAAASPRATTTTVTTTTVTPLPGNAEAAPSPLRSALARLRTRRGIALTAAAVVVIGLIAAAAGISSALSGPSRVATLAAAPDAAWPEEMFGSPREGAVAFEPFHGLSIVLVDDAWGSGMAMPCLFAARTEEGLQMLSTGCGSSQFPPTLGLEVGEELPDALLRHHPVGSHLQFVLDGDEVVVYAAD